jgi:hypothetical protein
MFGMREQRACSQDKEAALRTRLAGDLVTLVLLLEACSRKTLSLTVALLLATGVTQPALGFGWFTHEALIEVSWKPRIEPLLVKHSPNATPEQLQEARKYAYGGAIIQDLGYFPHANEFYSDLLHCVRSGDFIQELFRQASDLYEYGFALGALEHYVADTIGHPLATNPAVAIYNPKLGSAIQVRLCPKGAAKTSDYPACYRSVFIRQHYLDSTTCAAMAWSVCCRKSGRCRGCSAGNRGGWSACALILCTRWRACCRAGLRRFWEIM